MFTPRYGTVKSGLKTFKGILQDFFFGFQPLAVGLGSLGLFLIRKILWDFSGSSSWHFLGIFFFLRIFQDLSVVFRDFGGKISGYPSLFQDLFSFGSFTGFQDLIQNFYFGSFEDFSGSFAVFYDLIFAIFTEFLQRSFEDFSGFSSLNFDRLFFRT